MSPSLSLGVLLTQSDERLVGYARAGHERAFEALVRRYRRQLHCYCRRLLLSDERAEDALQQALLQAWVALRGGAEVRAVRPWLYRIVHNAALSALRCSAYDYRKLSESLSGAGAPEDDLERRIAVREALAGLAALPERQRDALLRTAVEGLSHQQVASDLGVSEPALRGLVYRARASLRAALGALLPPPLIGWAVKAGTSGLPALERLGAAAGGGSAGVAGLLVKSGAVAVTAGALAGGIVAAHRDPKRPGDSRLSVAAPSQLAARGAGMVESGGGARTAAGFRRSGASAGRGSGNGLAAARRARRPRSSETAPTSTLRDGTPLPRRGANEPALAENPPAPSTAGASIPVGSVAPSGPPASANDRHGEARRAAGDREQLPVPEPTDEREQGHSGGSHGEEHSESSAASGGETSGSAPSGGSGEVGGERDAQDDSDASSSDGASGEDSRDSAGGNGASFGWSEPSGSG